MQSNGVASSGVKAFGPIFSQDFARLHREIADCRTRALFARLLGYLNGAFRKPGMRYKWQKDLIRSFAQTSKFSRTHVEDAFPAFKRFCTTYKFSRVHVGRSMQIKIERNYGVLGNVTGAEIHARLTGAIRRMVELTGRCHVDTQFLCKFCAQSKLPGEGVFAVWRRFKKLPGYKCRWRGQGQGLKFVVHGPAPEKNLTGPNTGAGFGVSPPPTSSVISPPLGGRDQKQCAGAPNTVQADRAGATRLPVDPVGHAGSTYRPGFSDGGDDKGQACFDPRGRGTAQPGLDHPFPGGLPSQICNHWISPRKLRGLARWIACGPLKKIHLQRERVRWIFAHAYNFAFECLQLGYQRPAIERAWRIGVQISHEDALDRDRLPGGEYASARVPSAAKIYAIRELKLVDSRPWRERWAEFFARPWQRPGKVDECPTASDTVERVGGAADVGPSAESGAGGIGGRPAVDPGAARSSPAGKGAGVPGARLTAAEAATKLAELRRIVAERSPRADPGATAADPGAAVTITELKAYLDTIGMTVGGFNQQPWGAKRSILERVLARRSK